MPGWLILIFVALLVLIGVVALLLLLPDTEATESGAAGAGRTSAPAAPPPPAATRLPPVVTLPPPVAAPPVNKQPIVLRPRPETGPKLFIGGRPATPPPKEFPPQPAGDNGNKMKVGPVKVNLNAICRRTGRSMRVCSCARCRKERAQFGL